MCLKIINTPTRTSDLGSQGVRWEHWDFQQRLLSFMKRKNALGTLELSKAIPYVPRKKCKAFFPSDRRKKNSQLLRNWLRQIAPWGQSVLLFSFLRDCTAIPSFFFRQTLFFFLLRKRKGLF
ncbi:MAG: hypothetical protein QMC80_03455 [Thermoplasmatales archaeon]|nr:hypothetical protein [Thermoplasmatales archaeon]